MWVFFLIAVLNVVLGFAAGAALGQRWRRMMAARSPVWEAAASAPPVVPPRAAPARSEPHAAAVQHSPPAPTVALPTEAAPLAECRAETRSYQDKLDAAEDRLRDPTHPWDAAAIEECLESLRAATEEFLLERNKNQPRVVELAGSLGPSAPGIVSQIETAVQHQDETIQQAYDAFQRFDGEAEIEPQREQLAQQAGRLIEGSLQFDASLAGLEVELLRSAHPDAKPENHARDEHTGLLTRAAMESAIIDFWRRDPHRVRTLAAALLDVDQTAAVNQSHGHRRTDRALHACGRLLGAKQSADLAVARYNGQAFCLLFFDGDVRSAANTVEELRQGLEMTRFEDGDHEIRLTVSCGITAATPADTLFSLLERLEATLHEAKRYGRNRTFLHEGKHPAPVIPPNFTIKERRITLD